MTANERMIRSALGVATGATPMVTSAGLCLALVRLIVERAFHDGRYEWYEKWLTHPVERPPGALVWWRDPWARDMERSLRLTDMHVEGERYPYKGDPARYVRLDEALPGDIVFRWDTALGFAQNAPNEYVGHVGVLFGVDALGKWAVIENRLESARAPLGLSSGAVSLGPLSWPVTTIIRYDP